MLYLFTGDDSKNKNLAYEKFIKSIPRSTEIFYINRNDFDPVQMESFYSGSSLFSTLSAVVFKNIFEYEETRDFLLDKLKLMGESSNSFIFLEGKLNKPILDAFKKVHGETYILELPKEKKEKYDNFRVASAFADKNKFNTWLYFREAMDKGVAMEEIIGVLFWKIKDALSKKNFNKFTEEQLKNFISKLSYLLPEARKEGKDAESVFEQFLLEAF